LCFFSIILHRVKHLIKRIGGKFFTQTGAVQDGSGSMVDESSSVNSALFVSSE
jgi:hypothetical protein